MTTTRPATPDRPVRMMRVLRSRHGDSTRMVRPADFDAEPVAQVAALGEIRDRDRYVPLCVDWRDARLIYSRWDDERAMTDVPFLYQHQRRGARWLIDVPFEALDAADRAAHMTPTFIFSIGRCGSTLLSRLLAAAGEQAISEPDVLTSVAHFDDDAERGAAEGMRERIVQHCVAAFEPACGPAPIIKLRARCNRAIDVFLNALPHARYVFMCRDRDDWVRSTSRAFGDSGDALADLLKVSVEAFDRMHRAGVDPELVWYEDLLADPVGALRRILPRRADLDAYRGAIETALGQDAQEGSGLSRTSLSTRTGDAGALAAFDARWRAIRPEPLLSRYGLERLR
ncbi:sulfotransferase [Burkholderia ubonensis]|uniref:Sulfotransferase family protein n=1 Tax=Burkholderia ubonensis subsp. mesacidophila TaxID=265293 RepID=A0A2A4FKU5_9BURK|nr:sulfotransferase [Burkholderia ubonensis]PCE33715.1 sulfotransferase family protein [Burkholderia ubonensis subsp. mesacidophila]